MYQRFFGLTQEPFSIAPDPRYLFMSERHREALAHLLYGVSGGGGFVLLSGEIGAGKTTVCRCFMEQIPKRCNVAYIFNPKLTATELLSSVCDEFGVPYPRVGTRISTVKDFLDPLNEFLLKTHSVGQNNVLIIDEAQNLSAEVLEQLRLLTNLETNERKLLQIILIGQPQLRSMLAQPELEQLAQRVIARFHLEALSPQETQEYIGHRLSVAGLQGAMPFDALAIRQIHELARGVPRRINLLCDRALLGAYATGKHTVDRSMIKKAATEVFGPGRITAPSANSRSHALVLAVGLVAGAELIGLGLWRNGNIDTSGSGLPTLVAGTQGQRSVAPSSVPSAVIGTPAIALPPELPSDLSPSELKSSFKALTHDEKDAWRDLAVKWQLTVDSSDPCQAAQRQQVQCFRSNTNLAVIRQLDRPGILTLHDADDDTRRYALLTGLTRQSAALQIDGITRNVSLQALSTLWRGEFSTLWRVPVGYTGAISDSGAGPFANQLAIRLDGLSGAGSTVEAGARELTLSARVSGFQRSQRLKSDGIAGPTTFMQLNRSTGVDEPRLLSEPASH